ncbi:MAG: hypothetical protein DA330_02090 [Nitrososphaera sp.]|nr:hypothetical protein [Nitrososphaera sp.]
MRVRNKDLDRAQDLMWTAFDTAARKERIRLAEEALKICPDCADAYVVLAYDLPKITRQRKMELFEEGVKAGRRALGPRYFKEEVGSFWGILETRPYMRALMGLAIELEEAGRVDEAIEHYRELMRLNPRDNQGVRYCLAPLYLSLDRLPEAWKILKTYTDDTGPALNYTRVLYLFKKDGDTEKAREELGEAVRWNPHVVSWLLTPKLPKIKIGAYITSGGKDEAYVYARDWRKSWEKTEGAIDWLVENLLAAYREQKRLYITGWREEEKK